MKPNILIGLPTMSQVNTGLLMVILQWVANAGNKYNISIYPTFSVQPVDNARNQIVDEFLKSDCTHLFFVDADTIPPADALDKLLKHDREIVSGLTPIVQHDDSVGFYTVMNCTDLDDKRLEQNQGLKEMKGAGSSCILIKRSVFDKMKQPYYRFLYSDDNGKSTMVSEDIYFMAMALGYGVKAYCDTTVICKHYKPIMW